jgi:RNA recognition motif-containing protein
MNLFVGNLSLETTEDAIRKIFSEFGEIVSAKVLVKEDPATGQPRKFGFVEMADKFQAYDAIDNIDSTFFLGNIITVKEAKPQGGGHGGHGNRNRRPSSGGGNRPRFNRRF